METFIRYLLIILLGIPILGIMLYFLISLLLYADCLEEEKEKKRRDKEMEQNNKEINHDRREN